ncbi:MAG: transposase [Fimbriimonadaceae bacterium]|nr:transposase [Fimbriimonadaceae bacterium]
MKTWPHAPSKAVGEPGTYIITAATYGKRPLFRAARELDLLLETLLTTADELGWRLQAWAAFANHYHLIGHSPSHERAVPELTKRIHGRTAIALNKMHMETGRRVWFRAWDTRITYQTSYLARLAYVHNNPVKHGLVRDPVDYRWCSARWFWLNGDRSFFDTVMNMGWERVNI